MMMKLSKFFLLSALLFVLSIAASAQSAVSIRGRIVEMRGYIMHGLTVTARHQGTGRTAQAVTDDTGAFQFENLEPGDYGLEAQCQGSEDMVGHVKVSAGKTEEVELLASPFQPTGNTAVDKFFASSFAQGGAYPAGNISYLNVNDALDIYLMWVYFGILGLLS